MNVDYTAGLSPALVVGVFTDNGRFSMHDSNPLAGVLTRKPKS